MGSRLHSAALLAAALLPKALAAGTGNFDVFSGMASASYRQPFVAVDAMGGTTSSTGFALRQAGLISAGPVHKTMVLAASGGFSGLLYGGFLQRLPTSTPTASPTSTATPSATRTASPSATSTASPTRSATRSATSTGTATATRSASPTRTASPTATPSATPSATRTASPTPTPSRTHNATRTASPTATPSQTPNFAAAGSGDGFCAVYYDNANLIGPVLSRIDAQVNYNWGTGSPHPVFTDGDTFSVSWTAKVEAPAAGTYTFYVKSDDGMRFYIDGVRVLDYWGVQTLQEHGYTHPVPLTAGAKLNIAVEYMENSGSSVVELYWESAFVPKALIPQDRAYSMGSCAGFSPTPTPVNGGSLLVDDFNDATQYGNGLNDLGKGTSSGGMHTVTANGTDLFLRWNSAGDFFRSFFSDTVGCFSGAANVSHIRFKFKVNTAGTTFDVGMEHKDASDCFTRTQFYQPITRYASTLTTYQTVTMPVSDFTSIGLNLATLNAFRMISTASDTGGRVWFDDIELLFNASTPTFTVTPSPTRTASPSPTDSPSPTSTRSPTPTDTDSPTATDTPTPSATPTPSRTPFAELSLAKSALQPSIGGTPGETVAFAIVASNPGSYPAFNVNVWDSLPPDTTPYAAASSAGMTLSAGVAAWSEASIPAGGSKAFTLSLSYAGTGAPVFNRASAQADLLPALLTDFAAVNVNGPAFTATDTPTPSRTATPSSTHTPADTATDTPTPTPSDSPSPTDTPTASPTASPSPTPSWTPTASISPTFSRSPSFTVSPTRSPSASVTPTSTPFAELALLKSALQPQAADQETFSYVLSVINIGSVPASGVQLWDSLDPQTLYVSSTGGGSHAAGLVSWSLGPLAGGATASVTLAVKANTAALSSAVNFFSASAPGVPAFDSAEVYVGLNQAITATDTPTPTPQVSATNTPELVPPDTATSTVTQSFTYSPTLTPTPTVTPTDTPSSTVTPTDTPTVTETWTPTVTLSFTDTHSPTITLTSTPSDTPTVTETDTPSSTVTETDTPTFTVTETDTPSATPSRTPTVTRTSTPTPTHSPTSTATESSTPTYTATPSVTESFTFSPTSSATPSITWTFSHTFTVTSTRTPTPTRTASPTSTETPAAPALSLSVNAPAQAWENEGLLYSFSISNGAGAGYATLLTLYDSLPSQLAYLGPGQLQPENYQVNDQWRLTVMPGVIARGPYLLAPGATLNVSLFTEVKGGSAPRNLTTSAWLEAELMPAPVVDTDIVELVAGVAPTRTISPTFSESPTPTMTDSPTPYAGTPTLTETPTLTDTPTLTETLTITPNGTFTVTTTPPPQPTLVLTLALASDPALAYVGRDVSFTVSVSNANSAASALAQDLEIWAMRDLNSGNARVSEAPGRNASGTPPSPLLFQANTWHWANDANKPASPWLMLFPSFPVGFSTSQELWMRIEPSAAAQTLTAQVYIKIAGQSVGLTRSVDIVVPQFTPTANVTNTPTITPTPIARQGEIVAYPQPAVDRLCFDYHAPAGGGAEFEMLIYNAAFQLVGTIKDTAVPGMLQTTCVSAAGMAPGIYFHQSRLGEFRFPPGKFGVAR